MSLFPETKSDVLLPLRSGKLKMKTDRLEDQMSEV